MQIFIISCTSNKTLPIQIEPNETIYILKERIHEREGQPIGALRIRTTSGGKLDNDEATMASYGIVHGRTLVMDMGSFDPSKEKDKRYLDLFPKMFQRGPD